MPRLKKPRATRQIMKPRKTYSGSVASGRNQEPMLSENAVAIPAADQPKTTAA